MSVSWRDYDGLDEDYRDTPYEAEIRAAERGRLRDGWQPMEGYRRPVDPPCETHGYGTIDGLCGLCILELKAQREAA